MQYFIVLLNYFSAPKFIYFLTIYVMSSYCTVVCQPKDAYFSCLDLAAIKMIPWGMLQFIERVEFKIQDAPKKEITRIPLANITSKTSSSSSISYFNFNSSFSQSPPQYIIHASPVTPSPDLRFPARTPFKAVHFMLLSLGLSPNLALDCHNNKTKENNSSPLSFLTPLLDKTFNRYVPSYIIINSFMFYHHGVIMSTK